MDRDKSALCNRNANLELEPLVSSNTQENHTPNQQRLPPLGKQDHLLNAAPQPEEAVERLVKEILDPTTHLIALGRTRLPSIWVRTHAACPVPAQGRQP